MSVLIIRGRVEADETFLDEEDGETMRCTILCCAVLGWWIGCPSCILCVFVGGVEERKKETGRSIT